MMMEKHARIFYKDQEWDVPLENSTWDKQEALLQQFIIETYGL
jgi:hypothetical protein